MKVRHLALLALLALAAGCATRPPAASAPPAAAADFAVPCGVPAVDEAVPDFEAQALSGEKVNPASLRGKVVIADFWAMQCLGCVEGLQAYQDDPGLLKNPRVTIVAFCTDKSEPAVREFVKRKGWTFPVAMADDTVRRAFQTEGRVVLPLVRLLDPEGRLRYRLGADQATHDTVTCLVNHLLSSSAEPRETP